ncbi:MAG: cellulase family glycosylhydrolase [Ktedonobacterales bacterium]|nr:cellulase family glycosylhydrolase [Ktedonobacterales bacterium]
MDVVKDVAARMAELAWVVVLAVTAMGSGQMPAQAATQVASPGALSVASNHIVDRQGHIITLVGASRWALEFECHGDGHYSVADFQAMHAWGMNAVRLTLSSAYWLNIRGLCPDYRTTVAAAIANAEQAGLYVMPVLQFEAPFPSSNEILHGGALYQMPDMNAIPFWRDLATRYANDPRMIFEIYSEPHDVGWALWRNGGQVPIRTTSYRTPGMQALVTLINGIAPQRLVVVGGLVYAFDLSGVTAGYAIIGRNIVYTTHPYDYSNKQAWAWPSAFLNLARRVPVIASEFGEFDRGSHYIAAVIAVFQQLHTGYFAWAWTAGTGTTDLLGVGGWGGTPSAYGRYIRATMLAHA